MQLCKICNQNETDSTSGICWECVGTYNKPLVGPPLDMGEGYTDYSPIGKLSVPQIEYIVEEIKKINLRNLISDLK